MTRLTEQIASRLDGMCYRQTFPDDITKTTLNTDGLIVITGAGDDLMEIHGVVNDEYSGLSPHVILASGEIIPEHKLDETHVVAGHLKPEWCESGNPDGWSYSTNIPHATFRIMEDNEIYCIGLVIDHAGLIRNYTKTPDSFYSPS